MEQMPLGGWTIELPQLSRRDALRLSGLGVSAGVVMLLSESCSTTPEWPMGPPVVPHVEMDSVPIDTPTDLLQFEHWDAEAGLHVEGGALRVTPTGLSIVNKRKGDEIDADPPLNMFGQHLEVTGDFMIETEINGQSAVGFNLYGEPPLRFDDFRYERARVEVLTTTDTLSVRIWNGSTQTPIAVRTLAVGGTMADRRVKVQRIGADLLFSVNDKPMTTLPFSNVLEEGVWFGYNAKDGGATVQSLSAGLLHGGAMRLVDTKSMHVAERVPQGLQSLVRRADFRIGAAVAAAPLASVDRYQQLYLGGEVGSWTTENDAKPQDVQPVEGEFTFNQLDAIVDIAERNGIAVHGHALVYHLASPKWMVELAKSGDKQRISEALTQHVTTVVGRYKGRIKSWDVVNEAISGFSDQARVGDDPKNFWYEALGEEYIDIAFRAARAADPDAKLYINDYGLETNDGRRDIMFALVERLRGRGVPIDGIGVQGHVYELPRDSIQPDKLKTIMDMAAAANLLVRVSELDVTGGSGSDAQAEQYANTLTVCLAAQNCTGLTFWGLDDLFGSTVGLDSQGRLKPGDALLYDSAWRSKGARLAMIAVLTGKM